MLDGQPAERYRAGALPAGRPPGVIETPGYASRAVASSSLFMTAEIGARTSSPFRPVTLVHLGSRAYCVQDEPGDQDAVIRYRLRVNVWWTPPVEQISQPKSIWFRPLPAGI